jgi:hypothetical protein
VEGPTYHGLSKKDAELTESGCFGVVTDTHYVKQLWPRPPNPIAPFAPGSKGIKVQGPPSPRNIIFPDDTEFLPIISSDGRVTDIPTACCYFVTDPDTLEMTEITRDEALNMVA